ncbi:MAG: squalene/phytoene synthase family protein [Rhodospirillaceae bacterium]|nr:squalene/phytoene synthase family protein [Rhodospirillaceae bacterium]MBT5659272.1 squalene/phytoene synthase family protein [Rhodospirillaceae bacterium]MBT5751613.1 squalene/phytoene synthase family protein [Rhodospirillaceae bacterium]
MTTSSLHTEYDPANEPGIAAAFAACGDMVRRGDRDRYLCALFAPAEVRAGLFAIAALNLELARLPDKVSEPLLGQIRLQWWRLSIDGIYDGEIESGDDISRALAATISRFGLSRDVFERLIDARAFDLLTDPPEDMAATETYIDNTAGAVATLWLEVLGGTGKSASGDGACAQASHHVARAYGLSGLLRALPYHAQKGRIYLPASLMKQYQLRREDVLSPISAGTSGAGLIEIAREFAAQAVSELAAARALMPSVPKAAMPVLLPMIIAESALKCLEKARYDVFTAFSRPHRAPILKMALKSFTGRL